MRHNSFVWDMAYPYMTWTIDMQMRYDYHDWWYETWLIRTRYDSLIWDMTHWYAHATWRAWPRDVRRDVRRDSSIWHTNDSYITWRIDMHTQHDSRDLLTWDMTHSNQTWLIHMRPDPFIWNDTHWYETWLIRIETWLIHIRHDSFICTFNMERLPHNECVVCRDALH